MALLNFLRLVIVFLNFCICDIVYHTPDQQNSNTSTTLALCMCSLNPSYSFSWSFTTSQNSSQFCQNSTHLLHMKPPNSNHVLSYQNWSFIFFHRKNNTHSHHIVIAWRVSICTGEINFKTSFLYRGVRKSKTISENTFILHLFQRWYCFFVCCCCCSCCFSFITYDNIMIIWISEYLLICPM